MLSTLLIPVAVLAGAAALLGVCILFVSKRFHVDTNPQVSLVTKLLPGANCGACGFAGCANFAEALVEKLDPEILCPVGGQHTAEAVGQTLGIKMAEVKPYVCAVRCQGSNAHATHTAEYQGVMDCWAATQAFVGLKLCPYSCVGLGSCIAACKYGALRVVDGLIQVIQDRCTACGACIRECPREVLELQEKRPHRFYVACSSKDRGPLVKQMCTVGCIGCGRCVKVCTEGAITITNLLASITPERCTACGACIKVCPTSSITQFFDLEDKKPAAKDRVEAAEPKETDGV